MASPTTRDRLADSVTSGSRDYFQSWAWRAVTRPRLDLLQLVVADAKAPARTDLVGVCPRLERLVGRVIEWLTTPHCSPGRVVEMRSKG